jgi:hypothetical protein
MRETLSERGDYPLRSLPSQISDRVQFSCLISDRVQFSFPISDRVQFVVPAYSFRFSPGYTARISGYRENAHNE